jgi:hypothetical protein
VSSGGPLQSPRVVYNIGHGLLAPPVLDSTGETG